MSEVTTTELAAILGTSRQSIGIWAKEGLEDEAKIRRGRWDEDKAVAWVAMRRGVMTTDDGTTTLAEAKTRQTVALAVWYELRNKREAGEIAYLDDMEAAVMELFAVLREEGDREAARGTAQEQAWKRDLWHKLCRCLRVRVRDLVEARARGEDSRAAALSDSGSVGG